MYLIHFKSISLKGQFVHGTSTLGENDDDSVINCDQSENESSLITEDEMKDKLVKEQVRRDANNARER